MHKVGIQGSGVAVSHLRFDAASIVDENIKDEIKAHLDAESINSYLQHPIDSSVIKSRKERVTKGWLLKTKSIAGYDQDPTSFADEASENAIKMARIDPSEIGVVTSGSESKPYAVGTMARHTASHLGVGERVFIADLEGACNSGMQGATFIESMILSGKVNYGLAVGSDISQAKRGDALEYSVGAGAGALVLGRADDESIGVINDIRPQSSLFLDFWRREGQEYPSHFGSTTTEAYAYTVLKSLENLLMSNPSMKLSEFDYIITHQPNGYVPSLTMKIAAGLRNDPFALKDLVEDPDVRFRMKLTEGEIKTKFDPYLYVREVGNTYAGAILIALNGVFQKANPGENVLALSYGSGAYSNAAWITVHDGIEEKRNLVPSINDYIERMQPIDITGYRSFANFRYLRERKIESGYKGTIGTIIPDDHDGIEIALCHGCERIYFPVRDKCLDPKCRESKAKFETKKYPFTGTLESFRKLELSKRGEAVISQLLSRVMTIRSPTFDVYNGGEVMITDTRIEDLKKGMPVEMITRALDYRGKDDLILYGPAYRPMFVRAYPGYQKNEIQPQNQKIEVPT